MGFLTWTIQVFEKDLTINIISFTGPGNSSGITHSPRAFPTSPPSPPSTTPPTASATQLPLRVCGTPSLQRRAAPRLLPLPVHPCREHPGHGQPASHPRLRHVVGAHPLQPELLPWCRSGELGQLPNPADRPSYCHKTDAIQTPQGGSWSQGGRGWVLMFFTKAASSPCLLSGEAGASQADERRESGS